MCGFVGIYDMRREGRVSTSAGLTMRDSIGHRGPDGTGYWANENLFFGHARLSILDLREQANQPLFNQDKSICAVFNGEIYNFRDLKSNLQSHGHKFYTETDGEILPHLFEDFGTDLFPKIEGMFAIALYNLKTHRLVLSRDRFGIKPLYFSVFRDFLIFGSEIKAILSYPGLPREVDIQGVHDYLSLGYVPEPATGFKNIRAALPATFLSADRTSLREHKFWRPDFTTEKSWSFKQSVDKVSEALERAVSSQLLSDVPLGAYLSGGLDSSLVVTEASQHIESLPTFCVKFPDSEYDESPYARMVADARRTSHHELQIEAKSINPDLMDRLISHYDQPFGDSSLIPTYLISKEIRSFVKVALSGDGGDEAFGGYSDFHQLPFIYNFSRIPRMFKRPLEFGSAALGPLLPNLSRQIQRVLRLSELSLSQILFSMHSWMNEEQKNSLYNRDFLSAYRNKIHPSSLHFEKFGSPKKNLGRQEIYNSLTAALFEISLPGDMLKKVDMMSMLAGIEVRVPLLSERLVDTAFKIPYQFKIHNKIGKLPFRHHLRGKIPDRVIDKKKWGFAIPLDKCASEDLHTYIQDKLMSRNSKVAEMMRPEILESWIKNFKLGNQSTSDISRQGLYQRIFMLLSLESFLQKTAQPAKNHHNYHTHAPTTVDCWN